MSETTFPKSIATTRLELRSYAETDATSVGELIDSNRRHLLQNFPELSRGLSTPVEVGQFVFNCTLQWNERKGYCYGIWIKTPGKLIGQVKVKNIHWEIPSAELSYFIGHSFLRKGYASEAVAAVINVALGELGFNRVYVRIIASNVASIHLAQKLGMRHEALHLQEFRCGFGELHDVNYYSLTSSDYALYTPKEAETAR